jgi:hypothetical protein
MRALATAVAAALAGGAAAQTDFTGRYRLTEQADCAAPLGAPGFLRVEGDVLEGGATSCRMTNPVPVRAMRATLYDMLCSGDDATWAERAMLMRGAEGDLILVWDGYAFAYPACPKPTIRPRPRPQTFAQGG